MNTKIIKIAGLVAIGVGFSACKGQVSDQTPVHPNMNMDQMTRFEAQEENPFFEDGRSMREPVPGTVARGLAKLDTEYYAGVDSEGNYIAENPVDLTRSFLYRGKERYEVFCTPCHGMAGEGNGIIMEGNYGYVPAPSFHDPRVRQMPDGEIYSAIYNGVRTMPPYRSQIKVEDRWAIVAYIRALQETRNVSEEEIAQYDVDLNQLKADFETEQARRDSLQAIADSAAQQSGGSEASVELGRELVVQNACGSCHNEDGSPGGIGPTWAGLFGSEAEVVTQDGETMTVTKDEEYLRESIVDPQAKKTVGYEQGFMAPYDYLADHEIESLVLYIKSLSEN